MTILPEGMYQEWMSLIDLKEALDMGFEELVNWSIPETDMLVLIGGDNFVCLPKDGDLYA